MLQNQVQRISYRLLYSEYATDSSTANMLQVLVQRICYRL